jgi:tyrosinase
MERGMSDNLDGTVSVRREFRTLSQPDWAQYASAVAGLNAAPSPASQYDELGQIFSTAASAVFGYAPYLPFLRQLLRAFEQALQRLNPAVTLPYWNTALDAQAPERSPIFTTEFAGGNGSGPASVVASAGAFGPWTVRYPSPHQLVREFDNGEQISVWTGTEAINELITQAGSHDALRGGIMPIDGAVHNGIGGDMASASSPNDPLFYLHTANIDRIWALWQGTGANAGSYGGVNADGSTARTGDIIPAFPGVPVSQVLSTASLGYSYQ